MRIPPTFAIFSLFLAGMVGAQAQPAPAPAAGANAIKNGGFELTSPGENLWDGVDRAGYLAGEREQVPILTTGGTISFNAMPVSMSVFDMNGDGLLDLVMMDPVGYLRVFFNSGSKTEPKFTKCEVVPIYLSRGDLEIPGRGKSPTGYEVPLYLRYAPRQALYDSSKQGKPDLYVGNYWGEVFYLRNEGSPGKPIYRQPSNLLKAMIPTTKDPNARWGNVLAPAVWDWNKDGREDLLLGEGSYSANNIHLLINSGSSGRPTYEETNRTILAFGDGREQLTPAVVDYNGDGNMDLLVVDRAGKVAVYLNKGGSWKAGDEVPFAETIKIGGNATNELSFGGISTIATGDLNGDGLFDLIAGKTNGHVAVCYNTGTATAPKFSAPVELKGEAPAPIKIPTGWEIDDGTLRGNFYSYASVVTEAEDPEAKPPEGKSALRVTYQPSPNKVFSAPSGSDYTAALDSKLEIKSTSRWNAKNPYGEVSVNRIMRASAANACLLRISSPRIKADKNYTFSFKVKGTGVVFGQVLLGWHGFLKLGEDKIVADGDRGSKKIVRNEIRDVNNEVIPFRPSPGWTEIKKDWKTTHKDKAMNVDGTIEEVYVEVYFTLQPGSGTIYFDDFKITEK